MYVDGDTVARDNVPRDNVPRDTVARGPPTEEGNYSARIDAGGFDHEEDDYQNNPPLYDNI